MDTIPVFDSATTMNGVGPTNYARTATVGELRAAIAAQTGLPLNNFFLNYGGRELLDHQLITNPDEPRNVDIPYVTIMHRRPAANGAANGMANGAANGMANGMANASVNVTNMGASSNAAGAAGPSPRRRRSSRKHGGARKGRKASRKGRKVSRKASRKHRKGRKSRKNY